MDSMSSSSRRPDCGPQAMSAEAGAAPPERGHERCRPPRSGGEMDQKLLQRLEGQARIVRELPNLSLNPPGAWTTPHETRCDPGAP
jgi:hypothetical protein